MSNPISGNSNTIICLENKFPELNEHILIVDDDPYILEVLKRGLKNYHLITAENGSDALQLIKNNKIFLVLSDVRMPVMDGLELLEEIKKLHWMFVLYSLPLLVTKKFFLKL